MFFLVYDHPPLKYEYHQAHGDNGLLVREKLLTGLQEKWQLKLDV